MKQSKIAIVGAGVVGSTTAYTLMMRNLVSRLILVDTKETKCKGEIADLSDAITFSRTSEIMMGTLKDAGQADIIVITAGIPQKPGQLRTELLQTNYHVIKSIIEGMKPFNPEAIIIMVSNPVDVLTWVAQKYAGLPKNQIFGSGTFLDSQRLRDALSKKLSLAPQSIHLHVLGEHGDSQFVAWSEGTIAGTPLLQFAGISPEELHDLAESTKRKAYDIIACKGSTAFGIAACVSAYCENIMFDAKRVVPVSCYLQDFDVCLSMPAALGAQGIAQVLIPPLTTQETEQFKASVSAIKHLIQQL